MAKPKGPMELTESALAGMEPEKLACKQCGGVFCGMRVGRLYKGKPFIMCARLEDTKKVLESEHS